MNTETLQRFREGVAAKRFTLTRLAEISKIPLATLSDMNRDEDWGLHVVGRMSALAEALDAIEAEAASEPKKHNTEQGRQTSAA